ncbi:hypothetical protein [Thalassobacillus hwangdonensis]|uniref:Uncharacterized protein n=1 Tax=Thalassobacillus hwangdonensis TaxID=546108 RepID=A0ABW3L409_9BACI
MADDKQLEHESNFLEKDQTFAEKFHRERFTENIPVDLLGEDLRKLKKLTNKKRKRSGVR